MQGLLLTNSELTLQRDVKEGYMSAQEKMCVRLYLSGSEITSANSSPTRLEIEEATPRPLGFEGEREKISSQS
jgi:hypothetical protein